jgi:hypothetical protein
MSGLEVGEIRIPDRILSIEEIHAIGRMMEKEPKHAKTKTDKNVPARWEL